MSNTVSSRPTSTRTTGTPLTGGSPAGANPVRPPNTIDGETLPLRVEDETPEFDAVDALSRLLLGGAADLSDILLKLLEDWETQVVERHAAAIVAEEEDLGDILRYLLIGTAIQSQRQVRSSTKTAGSWLLGAANMTLSVTRPVTQSRLFAPARRTAGAMTGRLEDRIADLVRLGRAEEFAGRLMAEVALQDSIDWTMDYVAQNPEIRDLVEQQALGFTEEIAVGVRSRSITADNIIENMLRKILGRTPRADLPGPPEPVERLEQHFNTLERGRLK